MDELGPIDLLLPDTSLGVSLLAALKKPKMGLQVLQVDASGKYGSEEGHCLAQSGTIIDKWPVVFYARGPMAQLLLDLSLTDYLEFGALARISLWPSKLSLLPVPVSKEQVMLEPLLTLPEKRRLFSVMKALTQDPELGDGLLGEWLQQKGIYDNDRLFQLLLYAALQCPDIRSAHKMTISLARETLKCHRQSVEHLSTGSPFVFALWGMGSELAQAACRRAALNGVIQMMDRDLIEAAMRGNVKRVLGKNETGRLVNRWTFLSNEPLIPGSDTELFCIPPQCELNPSESSINILQLASSTRYCPPGKFLIVVWSLDAGVKRVLDENITNCILIDYSQCREISYQATDASMHPNTEGFTNFPLLPANYTCELEFINKIIKEASH